VAQRQAFDCDAKTCKRTDIKDGFTVGNRPASNERGVIFEVWPELYEGEDLKHFCGKQCLHRFIDDLFPGPIEREEDV
jgi:hypothetical protein